MLKRVASAASVALALMACPAAAVAAGFTPPRADPALLPGDMATLARALIADHRNADPAAYLDTLFRLQAVAGDYAASEATIARLHAAPPRPGLTALQAAANNVQYQVYARASARRDGSFDQRFQAAFREIVGALDDRTSAMVMRTLNVEDHGGLSLILVQPRLRQAVADDLAKAAGKASISEADALRLVRDYQIAQAYEAIAPRVAPLVAEDDARRYVVARDLRITTSDGAAICAQVVRPRTGPARLPSLMTFTIYADPLVSMSEARRSASNGYAGVTGYTRGKGCSPDAPVPREHDGEDAAALIDWIARQPWSDGRVGMFGGSYAGFTQWAAAKHRPPALKAMMPSVTLAPGINDPAEGGVADASSFYWPHYAVTGKGLNGEAFDDGARWDRVFATAYRDGRAFRDLSRIDGQPNPWFDKWLAHPEFDAYWAAMTPVGREFAAIDIPVLATTGYYDGGLVGATHFLRQHQAHRPAAEHYLVVGPYDHGSGNRGAVGLLGDVDRSLGGMPLDPAALIDLGDLRYRWFDHVFKGAPKPEILKDKVNFEVMGGDVWKHAASLEAMSPGRRTFYFGDAEAEGRRRLADQPSAGGAIMQRVDLADRSDADRPDPPEPVLADTLDARNALVFATAPFEAGAEMSGAFTARLGFEVNKRDFDVAVRLYEQMADGRYLKLSWLLARASLAQRAPRRLLRPGVRETLTLTSPRVTSRRIAPGSRIVAVVEIPKRPGQEINYGTGGIVANETVADAGAPLEIRWASDSALDLPIAP